MNSLFTRFCLLLLIAVLAACSSPRKLMPAPYYYLGQDAPELFDELDPSLKNSTMDILFVTDREASRDDKGKLAYSYGRSKSLAFGSAEVSITPSMSWAELEQISLQDDRDVELIVSMGTVTEKGRFPATPLPAVMNGDEITVNPEALQQVENARSELEAAIIDRLSRSPKKEVIVYVHGYNNSFEDAVEGLAEIYHFLGREIVPIAYTWPAGIGGIRGYNYDRESGEFTIFHLKHFLELLSGIEEIEAINLMAHSRGTDVLSTALREMMIETKARGIDPREEHRIQNLILAAPDLDMDVVSQRFIAEYMGADVGAITVYTSQGDKAIDFAERLFKSRQRIGRLTVGNISEQDQKLLGQIQGTAFVRLEESSDRTGHGYFHSSPEASSDLVMTLRYDMEIGEENGRPLEQTGPVFWLIKPGYPDSVESSE